MLFLDTLTAALTLDLGFFHWLFVSNFLWIFIFLMVMVFFQARTKGRVFHMVVLILMLYAFVDVMELVGWHIPAIMQFPMIAGNIALFAFDDCKIINNNKWLGLALFWGLFFAFNLL